MMREKTILNKLLNFQENNICAVGQRLHSPGNDYLLINKYKYISTRGGGDPAPPCVTEKKRKMIRSGGGVQEE